LLILAAGILLLAKGADFTVEGAEGLALKLGVSPMTIGLTVIAFGTSLPELVVSGEAFLSGIPDIGIGNIVGSCIANIGLIFAITILIRPRGEGISSPRRVELGCSLLMLIATVTYILLTLRGVLDLVSGLILLLVFVIILTLLWKNGNNCAFDPVEGRRYPIILTVGGLAMIMLGSHLLLTAAVDLAGIFNIPPYVVGFSMVAIGTSFPELVTSVVAALKKSPGISIGNLLGSNIFNLLLIPGLSSLVVKIPIPVQSGSLVLLGFSLAVIPPLLISERMGKIWASLLICAYLVYIAALFATA